MHTDVPGAPDDVAEVAPLLAGAHTVDLVVIGGDGRGHEADAVDYTVTLDADLVCRLLLDKDEAVADLGDGGCVNWIYFRRKAELGSFDLFSDIDSRIAHLARIGKSLWLICLANLIIGVVNIIDGQTFSIVNLLCSVLLAYGLGRIHGMNASLEEERALHE